MSQSSLFMLATVRITQYVNRGDRREAALSPKLAPRMAEDLIGHDEDLGIGGRRTRLHVEQVVDLECIGGSFKNSTLQRA